MRALVGFLILFAGCDDFGPGICIDQGALYCRDPASCCDRCQQAAFGGSCQAGPACQFGGNLSGQIALCGADGVWHLTPANPDLSANLDMTSQSFDGGQGDGAELLDGATD